MKRIAAGRPAGAVGGDGDGDGDGDGMELTAFSVQVVSAKRAERRAAPKPARIPSGDRPTYSSDEGHHHSMR
jgi:hypothetical protein